MFKMFRLHTTASEKTRPLKPAFCRYFLWLPPIFLILSLTTAGLLQHFHKDEDQRFEAYTRDFFCQEVSGNAITLHYTLRHPEKYGITHTPISLGSCTTDTAAIGAYIENALSRLHSYHRVSLSPENRLTYDVVDDYLRNSLERAPYALYEEPLTPLTGTQAQLPILLSEYQFYTAEDVDTYLKLLTKVPEYFHSILEFEQARSKAGLFMSTQAAEDIAAECRDFAALGEENYLYSSFEERLAGMAVQNSSKNSLGKDTTIKSFSSKERQQYLAKNASYIRDFIFPAYIELAEGLSTLKDTGTNPGGLCHFPRGAKYYELIVRSETGSSRTIPELQELTQAQMKDDLTAMQKVLVEDSQQNTASTKEDTPDSITSSEAKNTGDSPTSDIFKAQGTILSDTNPLSILTTLQMQIDGEFPELSDVSTQIKYVQESMEDYLSPAFYMVPAIDHTSDNTIYINQGHMGDDLSLFTTLAHEGYPGHLYQNVYYASRNPNPIRSLLSCGGYTEGWATYSEMTSYYYAPISKEHATLMQRNSSVLLGLYALADMGIHYDGWSLVDTVAFFRGYGITDTDTIEEIYQLIVGDPGNYLKYYIGYVEMLELKKDALRKWGKDFSQKRFHKAVLDVGPAPFDIVRKYGLAR